mgnify:CR=1 FL=1
MKRYAIIVAGGSGTRMKSELPKQFLPLAGKPVLLHTMEAFGAAGNVTIILVLPDSQITFWKELVEKEAFSLPHRVVAGGPTRFHSVKNGLSVVEEADSLIAVHDGVRPLIHPDIINRCYTEAATYGTAITAVALKDSIRKTEADGSSVQMIREEFRLVQTPQVFRAELMKKAFETEYLPQFTDCASVVEYAGHTVHLTEGDYRNLKITTPEDLIVAEALLKA